MEYLREIFIDLDYDSTGFIFQKILLFILAAIILHWLIILILVKFVKLKNIPGRESKIRFSILLSFPIFLIIFALFFFFVIKMNGLYAFDWQNWSFYVKLIPHVIVFLPVIMLFLINMKKYYKNIKG